MDLARIGRQVQAGLRQITKALEEGRPLTSADLLRVLNPEVDDGLDRLDTLLKTPESEGMSLQELGQKLAEQVAESAKRAEPDSDSVSLEQLGKQVVEDVFGTKPADPETTEEAPEKRVFEPFPPATNWEQFEQHLEAHNGILFREYEEKGSTNELELPPLPPPPAVDLLQALDFWNRRHPTRGPLLVNPLGQGDARAVRAQKLLSGIADRLGQAEPRLEDKRIHLSLFNDAEEGAEIREPTQPWTGESAIDVSRAKEVASLKSLREHLDPEGSDRPMLELGVGLGVFDQAATQGEMAFLLAKELALHLEHDPKAFFQDVVAAEAVALKMMTRAGYDPGEGLAYMEKTCQGDMTVRQSYSKPHQGVRMAAGQAVVEQLRRSVPDNLPRAQHDPLPSRTVADARSLVAELGEPSNPHLDDCLAELAQEFASRDLIRHCFLLLPAESAAFRQLNSLEFDHFDLGRACVGALEVLDASPLEPEERVDRALLMLYSLGARTEKAHVELPSDEVREFFARNGTDWKPDHLEQSLAMDDTAENGFHKFAEKVLMNPSFQKAVAGQPALESVYEKCGNWLATFPYGDKLEPHNLLNAAALLSGNLDGNDRYDGHSPRQLGEAEGPLDDQIRAGVIRCLKENRDDKSWTKPGVLVEAQRVLKPESSFTQEFFSALEPVYQKLESQRLEDIQQAFEDNEATSRVLGAGQGAFLTDTHLDQLKQRFVSVPDPAAPRSHGGELEDLVDTLVVDPTLSDQQHEKAFRYLLNKTPRGADRGRWAYNPKNKEVGPHEPALENFYARLESLEPAAVVEEILATVSRPANPESHRHHCPMMASVGTRDEFCREVAGRMDLQAVDRCLVGLADYEHLDGPCVRFLAHSLLASTPDEPSYGTFCTRFESLNRAALPAFLGRPELRRALSGKLLPGLKELPPHQLREELQKPAFVQVLSNEHRVELMAKLLMSKPGEPKALAQELEALKTEFRLDKEPALRQQLYQTVAERYQVQPTQLEEVFPEDDRTLTQQMSALGGQFKGLSMLVAYARDKEPQEQLQLVEYLLGRVPDPPDIFDFERSEDRDRLDSAGHEIRVALDAADQRVRAAVAASFLAGPDGLLRSTEGRERILERFLEPVDPKRRDLAFELARVLLDSQGSQDALGVGYLLALQGEEGQQPSEGEVLNRLFDAYGTPGIKLKQYLAFTSEFEEFKEHFEASQDSALPLTYLEAVRLADHHYGDRWPENWKLEEVLGSGSVNVAVRVFDSNSGEHRVLSLPREDVAINSEYDFFRMGQFVDNLLQDPAKKERFGFLAGLVDIIHDSVSLEFDRVAAYRMQHSVVDFYDREVGTWQVKTVPVYSMHGGAIEMAEAQGQTARRVLHDDPEAYQQGMTAIAQVEADALFGMRDRTDPNPTKLHANPDFHDGQVLIDAETKTVTILDFGQAVDIDNRGREYGADLLTIVAGAHSAESAADLIEKWSGVRLETEELDKILDSKQSMDVFTKLLGTMASGGAKVPLPVVHWVLGMNRLRALGTKIDSPYDNTFRALAVVRKGGGDLRSLNALRIARRTPSQLLRGAVVGPIGQWISMAAAKTVGWGGD